MIGEIVDLICGALAGAAGAFWYARQRIRLMRGRLETATNVIRALESGDPADTAALGRARAQVDIQIDRTMYEMASWDRAKLAIARVRQGLPPNDDLKGMASWDQQKVLRARADHERPR